MTLKLSLLVAVHASSGGQGLGLTAGPTTGTPAITVLLFVT